jgi:hypothetical protein
MAVSKKISALPSLSGAQVGTDVLTALDVSQVAALQNVQTTLDLFFGNVPSPTIINTPARTTPATSFYTATRTPADLALTADTESVGIQLGGNASLATVTRQFTAGGGAFATQREIVAVAPTYAATGAETITEAATFAITGPPVAGTNMTLTNSYSFWVQSGLAQFDSVVHCESAARVTPGALDAYFEVKTPADTGLLSGTENVGIGLGGDANFGTVTRQFAPGAIATQREILAVAPTYAFAALASVITTAATFAITNQPQAGTNATITNAYALWVQAGKSQFAGSVTVAPAARTGTAPIVFQVVTPADTALTASTESILNQFGGSTAQATVTRQFATGALTTQRENLFVAPTYGFVGASTLTNAATVAISGAPVAGTNATITNSYSLWVQAGQSAFGGNIVAPSVSGTDQAGNSLTLNPGRGTGTGAPGLIGYQFPLTTATGTALQALSSNVFIPWSNMGVVSSTQTTVANTVTETDLMGTIDAGSKTIEAGLGRVFRMFFVRLRGTMNDTGTPTIRFQLKLGSTVISDTTAVNLVSITGGGCNWDLDAIFSVQAVGATGSVRVHQFSFVYDISNGAQRYHIAPAPGNTVIDFTAAQQIVLTVTWGTANASNTITRDLTVIDVTR